MKRYVIAAITCIALAVGVSPATASGGLGGVVETVTETTQQSTNTSGDASASNQNGTWQSNDQGQTGYGGDASTGDATTGGAECCGSAGDATSGDAYGGDVTQSQDASNTNSTSQEASAESKAVQTAPTNVYVPICLAKSCETGGVEQSNTNSSFDWPVWFAFHAAASPELERFDCSTSPVLQCQATQTGTFTFTGSTCTAFDSAFASCDVEFVLDASCDCVMSPP